MMNFSVIVRDPRTKQEVFQIEGDFDPVEGDFIPHHMMKLVVSKWVTIARSENDWLLEIVSEHIGYDKLAEMAAEQYRSDKEIEAYERKIDNEFFERYGL